MKRILALDVGTVRIGVALSDPLGLTGQPLEVIQRKQCNPIARISELVETHEVTRVVVGHPLDLEGRTGPMAEAVESFVRDLKATISAPTELWDERLSTAGAERAMIAGGVRRKKRRQNIDKVAAALILQSYLDGTQSSTSEP